MKFNDDSKLDTSQIDDTRGSSGGGGGLGGGGRLQLPTGGKAMGGGLGLIIVIILALLGKGALGGDRKSTRLNSSHG